jgi:hypothetical protein
MRTTWILVLAALLTTLSLGCKSSRSASAFTPEQASVMAPVHQFIDGFNKGDPKAAIAACTEAVSIIDDFPPHEWHGVGAMAKWMSDYEADAKKNRITDEVVTLGHPRHVDVTADRAYVVVPANYVYKQDGKTVKQLDAIMTVALEHGFKGWLITGWAWAQN